MRYCAQCGTCIGVCPYDAIQVLRNSRGDFVPILNREKCRECGLCVRACPGRSLYLNKLDASGDGSLLGHFINTYIGCSTDEEIKQKSASGGVITSLLVFALEHKLIDGALVVRMNRKRPLDPEVIIARTRDDTISAAQSKYFPVPVDIALKKIIDQRGKFVVVGLPCHIRGAKAAETIITGMRKKIVLHIGLFCGCSVNFSATKFLLQRLGIKEEEVSELSYRSGEWPGGFLVKLKNGTKKFISKSSYSFINFLFPPVRCTLCTDMTNELADISVGDAWLPGLTKKAIVITRSLKGEKIFHDAAMNGKIEAYNIHENKVIQSQRPALMYKKKSIHARRRILNLFDKGISSNVSFRSPVSLDLPNYLGAVLLYFNALITKNSYALKLLGYTPITLLKNYSRFVSLLLCHR